MKFKIMLFVYLLINLTGVRAQLPSLPGKVIKDGYVIGRVEDSKDHTSLSYANVVLYNIKDSSMVNGCIADTNGAFTIKNIAEGKYYLTVDFIGYEKFVLNNIELTKEKPYADISTVSLKPSSSQLGGVEITSEVQSVQYKIDKKVINVSKNIAATGGSAVDALRNVPSVSVDADGNVSVRGSSNFTVLVNGKPTPQAGNDVLKQTPASAIENIEVITNPSAKYDPDGTAGIINIVMKKNRQDGINGILNASYGTWNKYSTDFQLNIKTGNFNIFGGAEYRNRIDQVTQIIEKTFYTNDTAFANMANVKQQYHPWNYRINAGADWSINDHNTLSLSGTYFRQDFAVKSPVYYHLYTTPATSDTWLWYENNLVLKHHWAEGNLNYTHNFKKTGHTLSLNLIYNQWKGDKSDEQTKNLSDADWNNILSIESMRRRFYDNQSQRISCDLDYTLPINENLNLEAGYSGDVTWFNSNYNVDMFDTDSQNWINDSSLSNGFDYFTTVNALYGTLGGKLWGLNYQLGLRGEYFKRDLSTFSPDTNYSMEIWSLFPSFHVSKEFKKGHQLQFSYSRRVNRPEMMALNPLPYFSDDYLQHKGNPGLRPEYGNSFELNYQKTLGKSFISVETYYRSTHDKICEVIYVNPGQTQLTNENITKDWAAGVEVMANITIKDFLRINASVDGYKYHLDGEPDKGIQSREQYSASVSLNPTFIFKTGTVFQIQAYYNAPGIDAIGKMDAFFMLNAALKQDFLKRKLSITLSANNLFNFTKYSYTDVTDSYLHHFDYIPEGNVFNLTLSYKINNYIHRAGSNQGKGAIDVGF